MRNPAIRVICVLSVLLFATVVVFAQKRSTIMGDTWTGVVESVNETTREITIVHPEKKTERFTGVLIEGFQLPMLDGTKRELKMSDVKPGQRVRAFYKSKTDVVAGQKTKVNVINRFQFLGRDEYTRLRQMLKVEPSLPVLKAARDEFPNTDPFKLYFAFEPEGLDRGLFVWVEQWNKEHALKYGRVVLVDNLAQADVSLVVIWGKDDAFMALPIMANDSLFGLGTAYLTSKDDSGLHVLWESMVGVDLKAADLTGPLLGKQIEKRLKARQK
jgi:hypothetical protein